MAVRPQRMHDGGIVERRLRPIYDWLDNGNNKKALQEAEKVLKKSPSLQAARALKALALYRLGKAPEARSVLDALAEEKPSDDSTLQAMTITYRESQELHKVCALYEAAVKVEPTSEELHSHLFMSYVRVGDYRSQQRAAMALYKFAPKNPYYFWAVMSIVLQAKEQDDATKKGILLTLAQRMVDNFISENKMEAEQEACLYIMILALQKKWEDILKFIESPLYSQLVPGSTAEASLPYLKKTGQWKEINLICKGLLWENQDRWDYYLPYFDSVFELVKSQDPDDTVDNTPERCHEFICQLVESMLSKRLIRGPYLARLELWKRLSVDGDPTAIIGNSVALCVQYLRLFAKKPCAVPDLKPYIAMIPQSEREEHCRDFLTCLDFDENSELESPDDIQRHISCILAWRLTAPEGSADEYLRVATLLRRHYLRCVARRLVTATPTEFCAADGYGVLAAHHYFYAAVQLQSETPIVEALSVLELVLHHSPANFHAKLLLVALYHVLGNGVSADAAYARLEVKHVQLLSLGWLHAARLAPALAPARALRLLADARAFHRHHAKDSMEHLTYAYKYGTFEKLVELSAWGERVDACAWAALVGCERALLKMLAGPPAPPSPPPPVPTTTDNRDLNAIVSWEPPQCADPDLKARTFEEEVAYLRIKNALVSCLMLCACFAESRSSEDEQAQLDELNDKIETFSDAMEKYRQKYNGKQRLCISAPLPCRIYGLVSSPICYRSLYTPALRLVRAVAGGAAAAAGNVGVADGSTGTASDGTGATGGDAGVVGGTAGAAGAAGGTASVMRALAAAIAERLEEARAPLAALADVARDAWALRDVLEGFSNFLELIGVFSFLLIICNKMVTPKNTKMSKKKTNQSPDQLEISEVLNKFNNDVQHAIAYLEEILDKWPEYEYKSTLQEELELLGVKDYLCPVQQKLKSGVHEVITDVKNIIKKRSKYLKSLQ